MLALPGFTGLVPVLEAASKVDAGLSGALQVLNDTQELTLVAWHGLQDDAASYFGTVRVGDGTPCAQALGEGRRVVIRDLYADAHYAPHVEAARSAGWRAAQSTPLKDRRGRIIGVLSTQYDRAHHPSPRSLRKLDRCCRVAGRLLETLILRDAVKAQGSAPLRLRPEAARANDAVRVLLPMLAENGDSALLDTVSKQLAVLIDELGQRLDA